MTEPRIGIYPGTFDPITNGHTDIIRRAARILLNDVHQHADPTHPAGLLRPRRERPRDCRAAQECDEVAPSHAKLPVTQQDWSRPHVLLPPGQRRCSLR